MQLLTLKEGQSALVESFKICFPMAITLKAFSLIALGRDPFTPPDATSP
jgi:hypothetical protein